MFCNNGESTRTEFPDLKINQAHIWRCDLDSITPSEYSLSANERERAAGFHFERDRSRFLAGRGVLRTLLARYLDASPAQLEFVSNTHGKPELKPNPHSLRFNISHSQNQSLFAFCRERDIGVDIEFERPDFNAEKIARLANRFFTEGESRALNALGEIQKRAAFFRLWTRKEALLKATGTGVAGGLSKFEISLLPGENAQVLAPISEAKNWSLFDLRVASEYSGALAVKTETDSDFVVQYRNFDNEP